MEGEKKGEGHDAGGEQASDFAIPWKKWHEWERQRRNDIVLRSRQKLAVKYMQKQGPAAERVQEPLFQHRITPETQTFAESDRKNRFSFAPGGDEGKKKDAESPFSFNDETGRPSAAFREDMTQPNALVPAMVLVQSERPSQSDARAQTQTQAPTSTAPDATATAQNSF